MGKLHDLWQHDTQDLPSNDMVDPILGLNYSTEGLYEHLQTYPLTNRLVMIVSRIGTRCKNHGLVSTTTKLDSTDHRPQSHTLFPGPRRMKHEQ